MKARKFWYSILFISFLSTTVLFNNCAGEQPAADSNDQSSTGEPQMEVVTDFSGKLTAKFEYVSTDGKTWGYALDTKDKTKALKVLFYAGGPVGTGTYVGEIVANIAGVGTNAGHYFTFKVPSTLANGAYQKLWAYGHEAKTENLIAGSPVQFVSYTPKAEAYYNQNIAPFIATNCTSCHSWTYASLYYAPLMNPLPVNPASVASGNRLIQKMSGGTGHNGGQFCTSASTGVCANLQAWWTQEFR